jgi:hypothetical protein
MNELLIKYSTFIRYWEKNGGHILNELGIHMKLVTLFQLRLNETYSKVSMNKKSVCCISFHSGLKEDAKIFLQVVVGQ